MRMRADHASSWSDTFGLGDVHAPRPLCCALRCKNRACLNVQERKNGGNVKIESVLRYIYKRKGKSRM